MRSTNTTPATAGLARQVVDKNSQAKATAPGQALKLRLISGVVMILVALAVTYAGSWVFALLVALAACLMLFEWNVMCGGGRFGPVFWLQSLAACGALAALMLGQGQVGMVIVATGVALVTLLARGRPGGLPWAPLGLVYAAVPALAILWLRQLLTGGFGVAIWVFAIVWATDIGGYAFGKTIGGPRLSPRISPNKTWAGLLGGMVFAAATSVLLGRLFGFVMPWPQLALVAAGLAIWAQIGDLAESALKRHFGVKDSGAIIPGHGGILDRLDGFVFVAPVVACVLWRMGSAILVGG